MTRRVTVIVPIYKGLEDVRACVTSVLRHTPPADDIDVDVLLIDDHSPEPEIGWYLHALAKTTTPLPVSILHNEENLGFVGTVNRGLRAAPGDAVILNADTIVTEGWLARLARASQARPDVATVTPLTNFGSLCTLPTTIIEAFGLESDEPRIDDCAAHIASESLEQLPEVITGVGFCMYVTRAALDACGLLDEEAFGQGYGEEVDFCLRASRLGFRHLVDDSTFVYHRGGGSFGDERTEGMKRGSAVLHDRYPFFRAANKLERSQDPLRVSFAALELGLEQRDESRPHVMQVLHSGPGALGGTEKHLRSLMEAMLPEFDFSLLYPVESGFVLRTLWDVGARSLLEREFLIPGAPRRLTGYDDAVGGAAMQTALDLYHFDAVHIQNIIGHSLSPLEALRDFDGPVVCSVRDLYLACPHHWLLYQNREACGIPDDLAVCEQCLPQTRKLSIDHLTRFRDTVEERLDVVDHWVFATQSAADYLLRVYDLDPERIELIEHGAIIDVDRPSRRPDRSRVTDEPLRLAFVGLGWPKKGLDIVNWLADALAQTSIEIHHFGVMKGSASPNLVVHGPYDNARLPELLELAGVQIVLLPGPYAETFGHVMTEAMISGTPVIAASYGALGERIRRHRAGWTIDPDDWASVLALIENLDRCRDEVWRATVAASTVPIETVEATAPRYAALYRGGERDRSPSSPLEGVA